MGQRIEMVRFAHLRRHIADVDLQRGRVALDRLLDIADEKRRDYARVKRTGAEDDQVRIEYRLHGGEIPGRVFRLEEDLADASVRITDLRLTQKLGPIFGDTVEDDIFERGGEDGATHGEDTARFEHRALKIPGHPDHCRDEEIAEGVTMQVRVVILEAILEEFLHEGLSVGERGDAV